MTMTPAEMSAMLADAVPMAPVTMIGAYIFTGPNKQLVHDEVVTTAEFLCIVPGPNGEEVPAIFPVIMDPELAEALGLEDTPQPEPQETA